MKLEDIPKEEIENVKRQVSESAQTINDIIPSLPDKTEKLIDEYMEQLRAEALKQQGSEDIAALTLPIYRNMMRMGAAFAMLHPVACVKWYLKQTIKSLCQAKKGGDNETD